MKFVFRTTELVELRKAAVLLTVALLGPFGLNLQLINRKLKIFWVLRNVLEERSLEEKKNSLKILSCYISLYTGVWITFFLKEKKKRHTSLYLLHISLSYFFFSSPPVSHFPNRSQSVLRVSAWQSLFLVHWVPWASLTN